MFLPVGAEAFRVHGKGAHMCGDVWCRVTMAKTLSEGSSSGSGTAATAMPKVCTVNVAVYDALSAGSDGSAPLIAEVVRLKLVRAEKMSLGGAAAAERKAATTAARRVGEMLYAITWEERAMAVTDIAVPSASWLSGRSALVLADNGGEAITRQISRRLLAGAVGCAGVTLVTASDSAQSSLSLPSSNQQQQQDGDDDDDDDDDEAAKIRTISVRVEEPADMTRAAADAMQRAGLGVVLQLWPLDLAEQKQAAEGTTTIMTTSSDSSSSSSTVVLGSERVQGLARSSAVLGTLHLV
jgi:hypothetical protein